jgi:hypothetical protein
MVECHSRRESVSPLAKWLLTSEDQGDLGLKTPTAQDASDQETQVFAVAVPGLSNFTQGSRKKPTFAMTPVAKISKLTGNRHKQ